MARFASQYPGLTVGNYQFEKRFTEKADIIAVKTLLSNQIHGELEDAGGNLIPIDMRVGVFDTEQAKLRLGWTDAQEKEAIDAMRNSGYIGLQYIEVEPAKADKPWNAYDKLDDPEKILEIAIEIDADVRKVRQYEEENQNRPEVLAVLDDAIEADGETVIVSA